MLYKYSGCLIIHAKMGKLGIRSKNRHVVTLNLVVWSIQTWRIQLG